MVTDMGHNTKQKYRNWVMKLVTDLNSEPHLKKFNNLCDNIWQFVCHFFDNLCDIFWQFVWQIILQLTLSFSDIEHYYHPPNPRIVL